MRTYQRLGAITILLLGIIIIIIVGGVQAQSFDWFQNGSACRRVSCEKAGLGTPTNTENGHLQGHPSGKG